MAGVIVVGAELYHGLRSASAAVALRGCLWFGDRTTGVLKTTPVGHVATGGVATRRLVELLTHQAVGGGSGGGVFPDVHVTHHIGLADAAQKLHQEVLS